MPETFNHFIWAYHLFISLNKVEGREKKEKKTWYAKISRERERERIVLLLRERKFNQMNFTKILSSFLTSSSQRRQSIHVTDLKLTQPEIYIIIQEHSFPRFLPKPVKF